MKDKTTAKRRTPTAIVLGVVSFVIVVGLTAAWFMADQILINRLFNISNFDATLNVSFDGGTVAKNEDGTIPVSFNSSDSNYIGKLRVSVTYKGAGVSMLRVQCTQQWKSGDTVVHVNTMLPYFIGDTDNSSLYLDTDEGNQQKWFDNRNKDYCFYYATPTYSTESGETVMLIAGFDDSDFDSTLVSDLDLSVAFEVQAVQIERYPQFWYGATDGSEPSSYTLPWPEYSYKSSALFT